MPEPILSATSLLPSTTVETSSSSETVPDWDNITFSDLAPIQTSGKFDSQPEWNKAAGYDLTRTWQAGQTVDQFLKLGDFKDALSFDNLTLAEIASRSLSNYNVNETALSSFELLEWQTLGNLVKAVPNLGDLKVSEVPPIQQLLNSKSINSEGLTISEVLERYSQAKELQLGDIDLSQYSVSDIPNLEQTNTTDFENWENSSVSGVPGLNTVPFSSLEGFLSSLLNLANVDVAYGKSETNRSNTISGSYEEGFAVPCIKDCAYVELAGAAPFYDKSVIYGKQWISGKYQKVKGGSGILGQLNNGKEPTGRHPFGKSFKVVVWEVTESIAEVETALFFRICNQWLGCSPYFLGPVPFFTFHETDFFPLVGSLNIDNSIQVSTSDLSSSAKQNEPQSQPPPQQPGCFGSFIHPAPGFRVPGPGGRFGACRDDCSRTHQGTDVATPTGTPIKASDGGTVSFVGWMQGYGLAVDIKHCSYSTRYAHLDKALVVHGSKVAQGEVIAESGNTGVGSGPHLHFEIRQSGRWGTALNPEIFVKF